MKGNQDKLGQTLFLYQQKAFDTLKSQDVTQDMKNKESKCVASNFVRNYLTYKH